MKMKNIKCHLMELTYPQTQLAPLHSILREYLLAALTGRHINTHLTVRVNIVKNLCYKLHIYIYSVPYLTTSTRQVIQWIMHHVLCFLFGLYEFKVKIIFGIQPNYWVCKLECLYLRFFKT